MVKFDLQVPTSFASVDCGSHGSSIFKSFVVLFRSALHMNHCWQWSISLILKVSGMLIRSIHAQLEWMKVFINNIILRLSFSAISLWVSSFLGLPSLVLQPKVWASGCLIFPSISMTALGAKRQTDRDRTQKQQRSSHFFGTTAPSVEEGGPSSSFCFCGCPLAFRQDLVQLLSCVQLCDSTNYSTPGYPVLHCLSEFTQIKGHWVSDIVQPFHLLFPPSPLDLNLSQHQTLYSESAVRIRWPKSKVLELHIQHQSLQWIFRVDFL